MNNEKKKIKIAIFSANPHNKIGGIETYTRLLIKVLDPNIYEIHEFYYLNQNNNTSVCGDMLNGNSNLIVKKRKKWNGKLSHLNYFYANFISKKWKKYNLEDFDVIIDNNYDFYNHPMLKKQPKKKVVHVQHFIKDFYTLSFFAKGKIWKKFLSFVENRFLLKNSKWKKNENFVVFDSENEKAFEFDYTYQNVSQIAIAYSWEIKKIENIDQKTDITFIGRIDKQKNIEFLNKMAVSLDKPLNFYGNGENKILKNLIIKNENIIYHGSFDNKMIQKIQNKSYVLLLTSDFEGFPIVIVEALSNGVPIIIRDTFTSAKFLVNNNKNGFLVPKDATEEEFAQIVNDFLKLPKKEYEQIVKNCLDFAKNNLSIEIFQKKWINVINTILEKNS